MNTQLLSHYQGLNRKEEELDSGMPTVRCNLQVLCKQWITPCNSLVGRARNPQSSKTSESTGYTRKGGNCAKIHQEKKCGFK